MRVTKVIDVCDRCMVGREKPATETREFALQDMWYRLLLCAPHADMFDRELAPWVQLAAEIDPPKQGHSHSQFFTRERVAESRRIAELREAAQKQAAATVRAHERSQHYDRADEEAAEFEARAHMPGAADWRITQHARDRLHSREVDITEVFKTLTRPQHTYAQPHRGQGQAVYQRGALRLGVDERNKTVLTVIDTSKPVDIEPGRRIPTEMEKAL